MTAVELLTSSKQSEAPLIHTQEALAPAIGRSVLEVLAQTAVSLRALRGDAPASQWDEIVNTQTAEIGGPFYPEDDTVTHYDYDDDPKEE